MTEDRLVCTLHGGQPMDTKMPAASQGVLMDALFLCEKILDFCIRFQYSKIWNVKMLEND